MSKKIKHVKKKKMIKKAMKKMKKTTVQNAIEPIILDHVMNSSIEVLKPIVNELANDDNILHLACLFDRLDVYETYKEFEQEKNAMGNTPFHLACLYSPNIVKKVLEKGDNTHLFSVKNNKGNTPVHHLAISNVVNLSELPLKSDVFDIKNDKGDTALMISSLKGNDRDVKHLLQIGCDVNILSKDDSSALTFALVGNKLSKQTLKELIKKTDKRVLNTKRDDGILPISIAIFNRVDKSLIIEMAKQGASLNKVDKTKYSPIVNMIMDQHYDDETIIKMLKYFNFDVDRFHSHEDDYYTLLIHAVAFNRFEVVKKIYDEYDKDQQAMAYNMAMNKKYYRILKYINDKGMTHTESSHRLNEMESNEK